MKFIDINAEVRAKIISLVIILVFLSLGFRLYQLQILETEKYKILSERNAIKEKIIDPFRGIFFDRNWKLLVDNQPSYTLRIIPKEFNPEIAPIIENYFGFRIGYLKSILKANQNYSPYIPLKILRGLKFEQISWIEENSKLLKGVDYTIDMERYYPAGVNGSHLFGYCKEISEKQLRENSNIYLPGDYVGHNGLEKYYEELLRGVKGKQLVFVDSRGREVSRVNNGLNDISAQSGYNLQLSIDTELQKLAEELISDKSGAIVAIDPNNGEIIALVSKPDFELKYFSSLTPTKIWRELNTNKEKPLFNRVTSSYYPPGSCFKMVSAIAALQEGVITPTTTIYCPGGFQFGNRFFKCHGAHGYIDVKHAIEKSCNTFFYQLILRIGFDTWSRYGALFGFGRKTGIDIFEENQGILPSEQYYNKIYGVNRWTKGFLVSLGIGQGEIGVTPLQMAVYASALANGGIIYKPHVLRKYFNPTTKENIFYKIDSTILPVRKEVMDLVREGMNLVVNGSGTASSARIPDIAVAGKTGTAQNPHGRDHSWFISFAPYNNPKIALAVIVENAGFGASVAAPISKKLIEFYLKGKYDQKVVVSSNNIAD